MISFAGAPGDLFNVLGKIGLLLKQCRAYQASQLSNLIDPVNGAVVQLDSEPDVQAVLGAAYISQLNSPGDTVGALARAMAELVVNRVVFRDNPQLFQNLSTTNTPAALAEVLRQMKLQGATVLRPTVTAVPGAFVGSGNGVLVASTFRDYDGVPLDNSLAENITATCTADSYTGGAEAGNETFTVSGEGSQPDQFAFDWPLGSDGNTDLQAIDGATDFGAGNLLTNSGYDAWTGNAPDNWEITVGAAGTQVFKESGIIFGGDAALRLLGDGATLTSWRQVFDDSDGTSGALDPITQYAQNIYLRRDGTAANAGQLSVELVDSGGVIIRDQAGNLNQNLINLTGLSTAYTPFPVAFRTPRVMPDVYYIQYRLTAGNALTNGRSVYFDLGALGLIPQLYTSGPFFAVFSGAAPFQLGDRAVCPVTNSRGAAGTLATFQTLLDQLLDFRANDLIAPSSTVPTISDSLIS